MVNIAVDSTWFRLGLRAYFVVAVLYAALVGDMCCHLQTKLRLLKGQQTTIIGMTGWLKGFSSWIAAARLRRLPGGWLGGVMLFTAILAIGADFGTAFVSYVALQSKCPFNTGIVLNASVAHSYPSYYFAAYRWASSAQLYSYVNGGQLGIYARADNSTLFSATEDDTLGTWTCETSANTVDYTGFTDSEICVDLYQKDLLYDWYEYANVSANVGTADGTTSQGNSKQLFIMTTAAEDPGTIWDIKVAVDLLDDVDNNVKTMQTYHCQVTWRNDTTIVSDIMTQIDIRRIMTDWVFGFQGALYEGLGETKSIQYPHIVVAWMLNSIVMVSGSGESVVSYDPGAMEGCIFYGTNLPPGVLFLIVLTALLAAILTTYCVFLWFYVRIECRNYDQNNAGSGISAKELCDGAPNGLLDWMSHSAYAANHQHNKKPAYRRLSSWHLSTKHHGGRRIGVVESGQHASPTFVPSSPMSPMSNSTSASTPIMHQQEYFDQKTGYTAVHNSDVPRC